MPRLSWSVLISMAAVVLLLPALLRGETATQYNAKKIAEVQKQISDVKSVLDKVKKRFDQAKKTAMDARTTLGEARKKMLEAQNSLNLTLVSLRNQRSSDSEISIASDQLLRAQDAEEEGRKKALEPLKDDEEFRQAVLVVEDVRKQLDDARLDPRSSPELLRALAGQVSYKDMMVDSLRTKALLADDMYVQLAESVRAARKALAEAQQKFEREMKNDPLLKSAARTATEARVDMVEADKAYEKARNQYMNLLLNGKAIEGRLNYLEKQLATLKTRPGGGGNRNRNK